MTPIEIIALIGAIIVPVKIIMLLKGQKFWFETITEKILGQCSNYDITFFISGCCIIIFLASRTYNHSSLGRRDIWHGFDIVSVSPVF